MSLIYLSSYTSICDIILIINYIKLRDINLINRFNQFIRHRDYFI